MQVESFGAIQTLGSQAYAKLNSFGNEGGKEWSDIWDAAKDSGLRNAALMAVTSLFGFAMLPKAQRTQIAQQAAEGERGQSPFRDNTAAVLAYPFHVTVCAFWRRRNWIVVREETPVVSASNEHFKSINVD